MFKMKNILVGLLLATLCIAAAAAISVNNGGAVAGCSQNC
jgi:hypothetical protein